MRGTDSQIYCDNTNRLRLGLLVHMLDLCKWTSFHRRTLRLMVSTWVCCLDRCTFKKQLSGREDYGFHCYMEICQFIYCLLSRTRLLSGLPDLHDWEAYMDVSKVETFKKVDTADFLLNHSFGEELQRGKTGEMQEFRNRCREFMDRLVDVLLGSNLVASDFLQGVYAFCPELLLEGDDRYIFRLFSKLVRVLERSGALSSEEAKSGSEEFVTFVVDARRRHTDAERSAEDIVDVVSFLLNDYSFLARKDLCRILKLCCLVMRRPAPGGPEVRVSLDGCVVPAGVVASCLRGVQSYVRGPDFKLGSFFTQHTMDCVRDALSGARDFMTASSDFDPWRRICLLDRDEFVRHYSELFEAHIKRKKDESYQRFRTANQRVRRSATDVNVFAASSGGRSGRGSSSVAGSAALKTPTKRPAVSASKESKKNESSVKNKKKSKKQSGDASSSKKC